MSIMHRKAAEFWWGKENVPDDVHHFYTDGGYYFGTKPEWKVVKWEDVFRKRKEDQEYNIDRKRTSEKLILKPCFIWVFNNHFTNFFSGYYLYIKTLKEDYAINFRDPDIKIEKQVIELFPCGIIPGINDFDAWAESFIRTFPHTGFKRKAKYQGLKRCWCEIDYYGRLKNILK